jgi:hypothetical protein
MNQKIPPFINAENASDKGFKDTLIWLSLLEYFKNNGGDNIIFVTDDKGFKNNADTLYKEFNKITDKSIEIRDNSFYNDYIEQQQEAEKHTQIPIVPLPDVSVLREKVQATVSALCFGEYEEDIWGNFVWAQTFSLSEKVCADDIRAVFNDLHEVIERNLFEAALPSDKAFNSKINVSNKSSIPMHVLQEMLSLFVDISSNHSSYLPQFFSAAANIFNQNYIEAQTLDDEFPF